MVLGRRKHANWSGTERRAPAVVLIVNDDPSACEMVVRFVRAKGYRAIGAGSLDEAIEHLGTDLPRCIVLDLDAGGVGTSLKVLDLVRSHGDHRVSGARVVLCAASAKNRTFSFQSGADSFVLRPFHIDDLVTQITDVLARPDKDRARHRRDELDRIGE